MKILPILFDKIIIDDETKTSLRCTNFLVNGIFLISAVFLFICLIIIRLTFPIDKMKLPQMIVILIASFGVGVANLFTIIRREIPRLTGGSIKGVKAVIIGVICQIIIVMEIFFLALYIIKDLI